MVHPVFLLVLCPDALARVQVFNTALAQWAALSPVTLLLSTEPFRWGELLHFFLPLLSLRPPHPPVKICYTTIHRGYQYWSFHEDEAQQNLRELPVIELILFTELCATTVFWICYFKASCSIVGESQRFVFLIPACQLKGLWPIWLKRLKMAYLIRYI